MSLHNMGKGGSEQREAYSFEFGNDWFTVGQTAAVLFVPYPCLFDAVGLVATGITGVPAINIFNARFIPGFGATSYAIGTSFLIPAFGTSGTVYGSGVTFGITGGISFPIAGSSLLQLMPGDILSLVVSGASAGVYAMSGYVCLRPQQDTKSHLGLTPL